MTRRNSRFEIIPLRFSSRVWKRSVTRARLVRRASRSLSIALTAALEASGAEEEEEAAAAEEEEAAAAEEEEAAAAEAEGAALRAGAMIVGSSSRSSSSLKVARAREGGVEGGL